MYDMYFIVYKDVAKGVRGGKLPPSSITTNISTFNEILNWGKNLKNS